MELPVLSKYPYFRRFHIFLAWKSKVFAEEYPLVDISVHSRILILGVLEEFSPRMSKNFTEEYPLVEIPVDSTHPYFKRS